MCGRFSLNATPRQLAEHFSAVVADAAWAELSAISRYNIAPSQPCLVVRYGKRDGSNVVEPLRWGYRPQWAKRSWINARDDTLFTAPAFREAARHRRCLVAATGWYEWHGVSGAGRQPYYFHYAAPFAFAGVWTARRVNGGEWERNFAIVTTAAIGPAIAIHDRMPLVLDPRNYTAWLDPHCEDAQALLRPFDARAPAVYPVSTLVNDPRNDSPDCTASA